MKNVVAGRSVRVYLPPGGLKVGAVLAARIELWQIMVTCLKLGLPGDVAVYERW